jgi:hypothetical protein
MRILLAAALVLLSACASGRSRDVLSQEAVVNPLPDAGVAEDAASGLDRAEAERRLAQAREAYLRGEYSLCLSLARAALEEGAPHDVATDLRNLRFEAKRRQLEKDVVAVRILPEREVYALGAEVVLELTVVNVSEEPVKIVRREKKSSPGMFVLSVVQEDRDVYGNVGTETMSHVVPLPGDLDVPVGGRETVRHTIPTASPEDRHLGFTELRFGGTLRPAVILCGEQRYYTSVKLEESVVRIFPPGFEPIAEDPVGTLAKAYRLGAREHLLVAAELTPPERRHEVLGKLVSFLDGPETGTWITVMAALKRLTGRDFGAKADAWVTWWEEEGRNHAY